MTALLQALAVIGHPTGPASSSSGLRFMRLTCVSCCQNSLFSFQLSTARHEEKLAASCCEPGNLTLYRMLLQHMATTKALPAEAVMNRTVIVEFLDELGGKCHLAPLSCSQDFRHCASGLLQLAWRASAHTATGLCSSTITVGVA